MRNKKIQIKNLKKSFNGIEILKKINLNIFESESLAIIGESGSGKSVLTKCIVGLFEPDKGEVFYNDRNFLKLKPKEKKEVRKEIGMLFQGSALFDSFSVEENVAFPLRMFTQMTNPEISERVNFCLKSQLKIAFFHLYYSNLSN